MSSKERDVFFVRKDGSPVPMLPNTMEGRLLKRGGSHGGRANWKARYW